MIGAHLSDPNGLPMWLSHRLLVKWRALHMLGPLLEGEPVQLDERTWQAVGGLALDHGLGPALWLSLGSNQPPQDLNDALRSAYHRNLGRMIRVRADLKVAIEALTAVGISTVPLKGAFHLLEHTFSQPAERFLFDLDLLVNPEDVSRAGAALETLGYRANPSTFDGTHDIPMTPEHRGVTIELHRALGGPAVTAVLPTPAFLAACRPVVREGVGYQAARPSHVVLHNVLHAQVHDRNHYAFGIALRQLHTFAAFVGRRGDEIDWDEVVQTMEAHESLPVLAGYVDLAEVLFGLAPPVALSRSRMRRRACLITTAFFTPVSDVLRNVGRAFDARTLEARYGPSSRPQLWVRHGRTVWLDRGAGLIKEVSASARWR
jgi:hypothetical protein